MIGKKYTAFVIVGGLGFIVDAGILHILTQWFGFDRYSARLISFIMASSFTWLGNRTHTFNVGDKVKPNVTEWIRYVIASSIGASANLGAYFLVVSVWGHAPQHLVIGVAIGSIAGMFVNLFLYDRVVFARRPP